MANKNWDTIISPSSGSFRLGLRELFTYRDLIFLFVKRDLITVYKQTVLGPLWLILQPLLITITFVIIFGNIAGISTDGTPKILFYMIGIITWTYFSTSLIKTSATFMNNAHIFSKVYFPRLTVPVSIIISNLITFAVQLCVFIGFYIYFALTEKYNLSLNAYAFLALPVLILIMACLGLGFGIIVSSLTTKYRDFTFLVGFGVQLVMYMSPVIFPLSSVSGNMRYVILANPMTPVIEGMRYIWLGKGTLDPIHLAWSGGFALLILLLGIFLFNRIERSFSDTI